MTTDRNSQAHKDIVLANLRRLWNEKKTAEGITQTQAAKELGWTQSAFSHYLVNITSLNDQAIIKLADFLDVAPEDIDPKYHDDQPIYGSLPLYLKTSGERFTLESENFVRPSCFTEDFKFFEINEPNNYLPLGIKVGVVPTKTARKKKGNHELTRLHTHKTVYCISRKTKAQKFKVSCHEDDEWKAIKLASYSEHYTAILSFIF